MRCIRIYDQIIIYYVVGRRDTEGEEGMYAYIIITIITSFENPSRLTLAYHHRLCEIFTLKCSHVTTNNIIYYYKHNTAF